MLGPATQISPIAPGASRDSRHGIDDGEGLVGQRTTAAHELDAVAWRSCFGERVERHDPVGLQRRLIEPPGVQRRHAIAAGDEQGSLRRGRRRDEAPRPLKPVLSKASTKRRSTSARTGSAPLTATFQHERSSAARSIVSARRAQRS